MRPFAGEVGPDFVLMDDIACSHSAPVVAEYIEQETIQHIDWPARSADISPIEYVWDSLQRRITEKMCNLRQRRLWKTRWWKKAVGFPSLKSGS